MTNNGTMAQPKFTFTAAAAAGVYFKAPGTLGFVVDGYAVTRTELLDYMVKTGRMDPQVRVMIDSMLNYPEQQG